MYQLKVSLRGARPPIWRRLLVPADITLSTLNAAILAAFDWHGGHLHVFETAYGDFGHADRELGHRADGSVTLEQVAPGVKDKIRYTYDFGDDWVHDIVVEKVLDPDPSTTYPRCTGGKRAAPPDDCGGIWGYAELVEVLANPAHPEHEERLSWLGLADASQFTADAFDAEEVNRKLGTPRWLPVPVPGHIVWHTSTYRPRAYAWATSAAISRASDSSQSSGRTHGSPSYCTISCTST